MLTQGMFLAIAKLYLLACWLRHNTTLAVFHELA